MRQTLPAGYRPQSRFMKILKHIAGILLATVGVMFFLGGVVRLLHPGKDEPLWLIDLMIAVLGILPLAAAFFLLRTTLTTPSRPCPNAAVRSGWRPVFCGVRTTRGFLISADFFLFGAIWGASRERQVRCAQCETLYLTHTRATRIAGVLVWIFILLVLFGEGLQLLE